MAEEEEDIIPTALVAKQRLRTYIRFGQATKVMALDG